MRTAASDEGSLSTQHWGSTTARARAALAQSVLCPQHSASSSDNLQRNSSGGLASSSLGADSQDSLEHSSGGSLPSPGQSQQDQDSLTRDGDRVPYKALQRNLLAPYKDSSEGSRPQTKAAEGTSVKFGRGQPLQALPEASTSAFQVSHPGVTARTCCHLP